MPLETARWGRVSGALEPPTATYCGQAPPGIKLAREIAVDPRCPRYSTRIGSRRDGTQPLYFSLMTCVRRTRGGTGVGRIVVCWEAPVSVEDLVSYKRIDGVTFEGLIIKVAACWLGYSEHRCDGRASGFKACHMSCVRPRDSTRGRAYMLAGARWCSGGQAAPDP